jgi:hypothetical protein
MSAQKGEVVNMSASEGWIKLHRCFIESSLFSHSGNTVKVAMYLLLSSNHKPGYVRGVEIERGQCVRSLSQIAEACKVSRKAARHAISVIVSEGFIKRDEPFGAHKGHRITICKYETYQSEKTEGARRGHAEGTVTPTNKNVENNKKGRIEVEEDAREALEILHSTPKLSDLSVEQWIEITADRSTLPADLPAAAEAIRREAVLCGDEIRHPAVWVAERLSFSGRKEGAGQKSEKKPAPGFTRLGTPLRLITPSPETPKKTRADELREMAEQRMRKQQEAATA